MRRLATALAAALLIATVPAQPALADGDPASDVLLGQDAYYPFQPKVPTAVADALDATLKKSRAAGYPLRVAIIATKNDLGSVATYFAKPQEYADFLQREIAFGNPQPLLIVMPNGYGSADAGDGAAKALAGVAKPKDGSGDALGRAAIDATVALAKADGKEIPAPKLPKSSADEGGSTSPAIVFGVPVLLLAIGGGLAAIRSRQRDDDDEPAKTA